MSSLLDMSQEERNRLLRLKNEYDWILKRLSTNPESLDILCCLKEYGPLEKRTFERIMLKTFNACEMDLLPAYRRCKAFGLVQSHTMNGHKAYYVDLTEKGLAFLNYYFKTLEAEVKKANQKHS